MDRRSNVVQFLSTRFTMAAALGLLGVCCLYAFASADPSSLTSASALLAPSTGVTAGGPSASSPPLPSHLRRRLDLSSPIEAHGPAARKNLDRILQERSPRRRSLQNTSNRETKGGPKRPPFPPNPPPSQQVASNRGAEDFRSQATVGGTSTSTTTATDNSNQQRGSGLLDLSSYVDPDTILYDVLQGFILASFMCAALLAVYRLFSCCCVRCGICPDDRLLGPYYRRQRRRRAGRQSGGGDGYEMVGQDEESDDSAWNDDDGGDSSGAESELSMEYGHAHPSGMTVLDQHEGDDDGIAGVLEEEGAKRFSEVQITRAATDYFGDYDAQDRMLQEVVERQRRREEEAHAEAQTEAEEEARAEAEDTAARTRILRGALGNPDAAASAKAREQQRKTSRRRRRCRNRGGGSSRGSVSCASSILDSDDEDELPPLDMASIERRAAEEIGEDGADLLRPVPAPPSPVTAPAAEAVPAPVPVSEPAPALPPSAPAPAPAPALPSSSPAPVPAPMVPSSAPAPAPMVPLSAPAPIVPSSAPAPIVSAPATVKASPAAADEVHTAEDLELRKEGGAVGSTNTDEASEQDEAHPSEEVEEEQSDDSENDVDDEDDRSDNSEDDESESDEEEKEDDDEYGPTASDEELLL